MVEAAARARSPGSPCSTRRARASPLPARSESASQTRGRPAPRRARRRSSSSAAGGSRSSSRSSLPRRSPVTVRRTAGRQRRPCAAPARTRAARRSGRAAAAASDRRRTSARAAPAARRPRGPRARRATSISAPSQADRDRVDGEVAPREVLLDRRAELHVRQRTGARVGLAPRAGDVERERRRSDRRGAEALVHHQLPAERSAARRATARASPSTTTSSSSAAARAAGASRHRAADRPRAPSSPARRPASSRCSAPGAARNDRGPSAQSTLNGCRGYPASPMTAGRSCSWRRRGARCCSSPRAPCSRSPPARGRVEPRRRIRRRADGDAHPDAIPSSRRRARSRPARNFVWAHYGYSKDRRRYLPASMILRPPYWRVWSYTGSVLLEFPPVMAEGKLFLLKNNGALHAIDKRTASAVDAQARRPGRRLARLRQRAVFVTLLSRGNTQGGRGLRAARHDGKILWKRLLPVALGVLSAVRRRPRLLRLGERHRLHVRAGDGAVRWKYKANGRGQGRARAGQRQALLRRLRRPRLRDPRRPTAARCGRRAPRARTFGLARATSTRRRRWPTAASTSATPTATCTRSRPPTASSRGPRAPAPTSTPRPRWRRSRAEADRLLRLLRRHVLRARRAHRQGALDAQRRRQDLRRRDRRRRHRLLLEPRQEDTTGLGARTGRRSSTIGRGAYNPVIWDGRTIFLTGYSSLYALRPLK